MKQGAFAAVAALAVGVPVTAAAGHDRHHGGGSHHRHEHALKHVLLISVDGLHAASYFGVPLSEPNHPDLWGAVQVGVVYTGGKGKIAEHGGSNPDDRDVPLVVYAPEAVRPNVSDQRVETTQIAPTIIRLLGLDPDELQAVQREGTPVLPGVGH